MGYFVSLLVVLTSILFINGEPAALAVIAVTTSSVTLEFNTENWPGASTYHVEYSEIPILRYTTGAQVEADLDYKVDRIKQPGLIPGVKYTMRVVPMVNNVPGTPSDSVEVTIPRPAILAVPVVVRLTTLTVTVEFQAANGSVDNYQIEYSMSYVGISKPATKIMAHPGETVYRLSPGRLVNGYTYWIRIVPLVGEDDHRGIPSPYVVVKMPNPVITDAPSIHFLSSSSVSVEFCHSKGRASFYDVDYKVGGYEGGHGVYTRGTRVPSDGRETPYTAQQHGLMPDTEYTLRIVPAASHHAHPSPTVTFTTPGNDFTPGPVNLSTCAPTGRNMLPPAAPSGSTTMVANVPCSPGVVVPVVIGVGCFVGGFLVAGIIFVIWKRCTTKIKDKKKEPKATGTPHPYEELHLGREPQGQSNRGQSLPPVPPGGTQSRPHTTGKEEPEEEGYIEVF